MLSVVVVPLIVVISILFFGRVSKLYEAYQEQEANLSTSLQENLSGIRVVKAFARGDYERDRFEVENSETTAPSSPAWNQCQVSGRSVY